MSRQGQIRRLCFEQAWSGWEESIAREAREAGVFHAATIAGRQPVDHHRTLCHVVVYTEHERSTLPVVQENGISDGKDTCLVVFMRFVMS
jgi:hypothetical protein